MLRTYCRVLLNSQKNTCTLQTDSYVVFILEATIERVINGITPWKMALSFESVKWSTTLPECYGVPESQSVRAFYLFTLYCSLLKLVQKRKKVLLISASTIQHKSQNQVRNEVSTHTSSVSKRKYVIIYVVHDLLIQVVAGSMFFRFQRKRTWGEEERQRQRGSV